jgi:hypothetical protein
MIGKHGVGGAVGEACRRLQIATAVLEVHSSLPIFLPTQLITFLFFWLASFVRQFTIHDTGPHDRAIPTGVV